MDVILLVGSTPEEAHPVIGMQIRQAVMRGTRLIVVDPRKIALSEKADLHLMLKPGTNVAFVNGMINIIISEGLVEKEGHSFIEINTEDARRLGIADREQVKLTSRRGSIESQARVSDKVSPGETWMPFHFPDGLANILTNTALDKYARIPEYKVCAIRIDKLP